MSVQFNRPSTAPQMILTFYESVKGATLFENRTVCTVLIYLAKAFRSGAFH